MKENGNDNINDIKNEKKEIKNQTKEEKKNNNINQNEIKDAKNINNEKNEIKTKDDKKEIKKEEDKNKKTEENTKDKNINTNIQPIKPNNKIFSSVITTGKEKINDIYLKKIKDLSNIYLYTSNYLSFISQLFKKTSEPFYSKLSSTYINNIKPYIKYFTDLISILNSFSEKLNVLNSSINPEFYTKDEESIIYSENNLNLSVKKINTTIGGVYNQIVNDIKLIMNKPGFFEYETIQIKFEENFHKMLELISNLEQLRIKYDSDFSKKYVNIFNVFIEKYNEMDNYLLNMNNFFSIEYDIVSSANFVMKQASEFILNIEKLYEESINIFCNYLEILKLMIKIYYQENKKIILMKIFPEKMIADLEKLLIQNIRKNIDKKFCIRTIIENYHDEKLINEINHLLLNNQEILSKFQIIKNEHINDLSKFNLQYYKTTKIFFNFLKKLIPPTYQFKYEDGIQFKCGVKRDCGLFKGWKECQMVISYQGHILFFDEEVKNLKNLKNNINDDDDEKKAQSLIIDNKNLQKEVGLENLNNINNNINNYKIDEAKYGIVPENLSVIYFKNSYGIRKKEKKQGKYLFEMWEKSLGNKRKKINIFDALNAKNLENILLELTETNIYED